MSGHTPWRDVRRTHKPRVSYCTLTRKWIVSPNGWRHRCGCAMTRDTAWTSWTRAMDAANLYKFRRQGNSRQTVSPSPDGELQ